MLAPGDKVGRQGRGGSEALQSPSAFRLGVEVDQGDQGPAREEKVVKEPETRGQKVSAFPTGASDQLR